MVAFALLTAEVNSHDKYHMAHKPKIFPIWPFKKRFAHPCLRVKAVPGTPNKNSSNLSQVAQTMPQNT